MAKGYDYSFIGFTLDAGSWADWFAGGASAAAVIVALGTYWIADRQRKGEARDRALRASESVFWKMVQVLNFTEYIRGHIREGLTTAPGAPEPEFLFPRVRPLGVGNQVISDLNSEELSLLIRAKGASIAMDLSECISRYESVRYAMQEYKNRHEALFELLPPPVAGDGAIFSHKLSPAEAQKALPYMRMLDLLLRSIIEIADINLKRGQALLDRYPELMKEYFGKWTLELEGPTASNSSPP